MRTYVRVGNPQERLGPILHADLPTPFYASVEQREDPRLRHRPVIVGAGVVLAASYEAEGRSACGRRWRASGPAALPGRRGGAAALLRLRRGQQGRCFAVFEDTTPLVEGISIDEAFSTWAGSGGSPVHRWTIAVQLRHRVQEQVGLPSRSAWPDKFLAKVARPGGQTGRPARGSSRPRAGVPGSASGRDALGRREGDRSQAERARDPHRRRRHRGPGTRPGLHARTGGRTAGARPRPQPRSPSDPGGPRRRSIGSQRAMGWAAGPPRRSTPV